jgi:preprotein translocase subunit SecA
VWALFINQSNTPKQHHSGGLHQALEAKEGLEVQSETQPTASVTFQVV